MTVLGLKRVREGWETEAERWNGIHEDNDEIASTKRACG
jgi:hypothetical protein